MKKCIYCDKPVSLATTTINYPNGKVAHYVCHLENNK